MSDTTKKPPVRMEVPKELARGVYSNMVSITVAENEVILDFAMMMPNGQDAEVVSRVVLTPQVAKNFMSAFQNALLDFDIARKKREKSAA